MERRVRSFILIFLIISLTLYFIFFSVFSGGQVFLAEIFGTMLLVYNVFATIDIPTAGGGPLGVFPIAMSVMVAHLFLLPIDGCSINPARSFGPSFLAALSGMSKFLLLLFLFISFQLINNSIYF